VPVLPGASLKGVASSAAHLLMTDPVWRRLRTDDEDDGESARYLFGTTERAGDVVFHDAWWIPDDSAHGGALKTPLKADVMTVHHPDYYQPTGSDGRKLLAPDGMQSPVPISFLSATGTFLVALEGDDEGWVKAARELLLLGLEHLGIGAKTSSGYGRFGPTEDPWLESERTRIKEEVLRAAEDRKAANAPPEMRARLHAERRLADEGAPSFLKDAHAEMHRDVATPSPEDVATWLAIADVLDAKIEKFTGLGTQYQLKSLAENLRTKAGVESAKAVSSEVETVKPGALVTSWVNAWTRAKRPGAKALGNAVSVKEDQVKVKASQWQKFATEAFPSACPADYVPTAEVVDAIAAVLGDAAQAWREWATQP
jgi:CRISPR type III-B/RAMP module RAMP protein Cmr6